MIDLKTLKEIVKLMVTNGLTEVDLQDHEGERVTLKRAGHDVQPVYAAAPAPAPAPVFAAPMGAPVITPVAAASSDAGLVPIASPMVGTFYSAATPDAKAFAVVGSKVTADTVVCIIEAMKVFNEIKAETSGTIEKVVVSNGQAVEFGQPLFLIRPG